MNKWLVAFLLLLPTPALAWEQTMTCGVDYACMEGQTPLPTAWSSSCVKFHLNELGTSAIALEDIEEVVRKSCDAWVEPHDSSLYVYYSGRTNEDRVGFNPYIDENANIIVFRDQDTWQESHAMMALTTVTHRNSTGEIYDADIEINTSDYEYGIFEKDGENVVDLQNVLTHEMGHAFGLAHSTNIYATMFTYSSTGETELRDLAQDDIEAISTIYPLPEDGVVACIDEQFYFEKPPYEMDEQPPSMSSSCSVDLHRPPSFWCLVLFWLTALLVVRTRKSGE